jgi:hypothetical protein
VRGYEDEDDEGGERCKGAEAGRGESTSGKSEH